MFMKEYGEQTYALLRIVAGFLFFFHGTQKLFGFPPPRRRRRPLSFMGRASLSWSAGFWS